jgi:hypothetical protein
MQVQYVDILRIQLKILEEGNWLRENNELNLGFCGKTDQCCLLAVFLKRYLKVEVLIIDLT